MTKKINRNIMYRAGRMLCIFHVMSSTSEVQQHLINFFQFNIASNCMGISQRLFYIPFAWNSHQLLKLLSHSLSGARNSQHHEVLVWMVTHLSPNLAGRQWQWELVHSTFNFWTIKARKDKKKARKFKFWKKICVNVQRF